MFDNIGRKIETLAKLIAWCGIVLAICTGLACFMFSPISGILVSVLGSLAAWCGSFVLYGFGRLIEQSEAQTLLLKNIAQATATTVTYLRDTQN